MPPALVRAIERIRRQGLNDRLIFPRRGQRGSGEWNSGTLSGKVRPWRNAAGLGSWFVLYALRHRFYTTAVHEANLTAEVAGKVGDTGAETIRSTYLHADDRAIFEAAERITRAGRKR